MTRSASHRLVDVTAFMPRSCSLSASALLGSLVSLMSFGAGECSTDGRMDRAEEPLTWPGCLKTEKLIDFLCGWMLQEMVLPAVTWTHRTR